MYVYSELCCKACKWEGKHRGHNVIPIGTSKDFMKGKLKESIKANESDVQTLQDIMKKATDELEDIQTKKKQAKEQIKQKFNEVKSMLTEKEAGMMKAIEETRPWEEKFSQLINDTQNIIDDLSSKLTTGKALLEENWDDKAALPDTTDRATFASKKGTAANITKIKETYNQIRDYETVLDSTEFENKMKGVVQSVNELKEITLNRILPIPKDLTAKGVGPFFVLLGWTDKKQAKDCKYTVSIQNQKSSKDKPKFISSSKNSCTVDGLDPDTSYKFSVRVKRGVAESEWSDAIIVKTKSLTVEDITTALRDQCNDPLLCAKSLEHLITLTNERKNDSITTSLMMRIS